MRLRIMGGIGVAIALIAAGVAGGVAAGAPKSPDFSEPSFSARPDDLPNPLGEAQAALKKEAINRVINGSATPETRNGSQVVRVGGNRFAELKKQPGKTDQIFVVLSQFSNNIHPVVGGTPGPLHNLIPEPDRAQDNTTTWLPDYNSAHYDQVYNGASESLANIYSKMSGGQYTTHASVSDWVTLPFNEARYGSNNFSQTSTYWPYVRDSGNAWYNAQISAGKTPAEITAYLKQFDQYDRYDYDGDGNFNEPDGYIDHFQTVHAGVGEEAGGGAQGADAIWSHRWYAYSNLAGSQGPAGNLLGGTQIGSSGIWIGDYTVQPENGGLGVFAHEFGHDLGLPDLYDTNGGDNGTAFWTIMSAGGWLSHSTIDIGSSPDYMGPWEKLFLGWLNYQVVGNGSTKTVSLGSAALAGGSRPQAVVVPLPTQTLTTNYNTPHSGSFEWWGGSADGINNTLTRDVDLTGATTSASLNTSAWYDIETGFDFLYGEVSTNGGTSWNAVGSAVDGDSGGAWVPLSYDLSAYKGQNIKFRFRYQTDGGVHYAGPFLDDISLVTDGTTAWSDDVEAGAGAWTPSGFTRMGGSTSRTAEHFYMAEYRTYTGYDANLQTGPYNFGWLNTQPNLVEKFPFQDGLVVWYVNYAFEDNNTSAHPGGGLTLPVDSRPAPVAWPGCSVAPNPGAGNPNGLCKLGNRRQPFDAVFGTQATDAVTFHRNGVALTVPSSPAITTFTDTNPNAYWSAANPWSSVKVAGDGVTIMVVSENLDDPAHPVMVVKVTN